MLLVLGFISVSGNGCQSTRSETALTRFEFSRPEMGSLFRITMYAPDEASARAAATNAFARVAKLNDVMSDYDPESELMRLCRQPVRVPVRVSADLFDILERSQKLARQSEGAFDVTVGPLVQLWRGARRKKALPPASAIEAARQRVGYRHLKLDARARAVTLLAPDMRLDLGGIAKGYAADQALAVLRRHGITRAMCAASGDIAIGDPPPGKTGWRIGIGRIHGCGDELEEMILLRNAGISTSGDTEQFVEIGGARYSHIVDPHSGIGLTNHIQVTVIAPNATLTDGLATAVSVMGATRGMKLIESQAGIGALVVAVEGNEKRVIESRRFRNRMQAGH